MSARRAVLAVTLVGMTQHANAAQTLVGTWAPDPAICTPAAGMISVGPLSLTADETACRFTDVARVADRVTWHGTCSDDTSRTPTTVVATLHDGGLLTLVMNGRRNGAFRRCKAG